MSLNFFQLSLSPFNYEVLALYVLILHVVIKHVQKFLVKRCQFLQNCSFRPEVPVTSNSVSRGQVSRSPKPALTIKHVPYISSRSKHMVQRTMHIFLHHHKATFEMYSREDCDWTYSPRHDLTQTLYIVNWARYKWRHNALPTDTIRQKVPGA